MIVMIVISHYSGFGAVVFKALLRWGTSFAVLVQCNYHLTEQQAPAHILVTTFLGGRSGSQVCCIFY
jgi:hypothetical protein